MAVAQVKQRIEPKVLAALVNRFTAETAEFLTAFATQAEAKLLQLSQRLERLERLVALFERKVQHLDPAPSGPSVSPGPAAEPVSACSVAPSEPQEPTGHEAPEVQAVQAAAPQEDEKYAVYRRMHRTGVPLLAIRQKLLLDALQDPTLDVAVLDTFDGAAGTGAGAPAPKTAPAPAPTPAPKPKEVAIEEPPPAPAAPEEEPSPAPAELPAPGGGGPINLAAAAAAMAQRRMSRVAAKAEGSEPGESKAPTETAPAGPKGGPPKAKPKAMPKAEEPAVAPAAPAAPAAAAAPAGPIGLFAAAEEGTAPKAPVRTPPPPPKAKASAMSPEAALRLRRSVVAQVQEDDAQSDVSDF